METGTPLLEFVDLVESHWPLLVAALVGAIVASLVWLRHGSRRVEQAFEAGLSQDADKRAAATRLMEERLEIRVRESTRLEGRLEALGTELGSARATLEERTGEVAEYRAKQAALEARLEESRKAFNEKEALFRESSNTLKQEFELLANKIFEHQGKTAFRKAQQRPLAVQRPDH